MGIPRSSESRTAHWRSASPRLCACSTRPWRALPAHLGAHRCDATSALTFCPLRLRFFNPPDTEGEDYKGGRTLEELKKFAATELGPGCAVDTIENCSESQKKELETYIAMPTEERSTMLESLKTELADAEAAHEALLKELQANYKESMDKIEKLKESSAPKIKMLKAATPMVKDAGKDEV